ncbi:MAG: type II secretion system F family protein [Gammaproteobacteria bacterium]|nr:type II secretion system F family protein [Gammaproteobacteria bacterium]MDJ0890062.1 type II secretion system F family protein [Gammaproteobacteria bacterium]
MTQFQYKAMDSAGRINAGTMDAANVADLELRLNRMGLDFIRGREVRKRTPQLTGARIRRRDLIAFCFHLEQLTAAGVPLIEGLTDLRDTMEHPRFREVLASIIEAIEGGATLSMAMEAFPRVFDSVTISLIRAGEQSGRLTEVFQNLTESLKWQDEQIAQTIRLLIYPALVGALVTGLVFFLMTYLVPKLVTFINVMDEQLPLHTKALLQVSSVFVQYWHVLLTAPLLLVAVAWYAARVNPSVRYMVDAHKLRIWLLGPLLKKTILARFANYFALLYASGISVLECLRISQSIVGNQAVSEALRRAGQQIADGSSIGDSFEYAGLFPPLVLRMLRVGENTGALEAALLNVSYFYSRDVKESVERLQALLGPVMTLLLAVVLGWILFSVLGPIYDLIATIRL